MMDDIFNDLITDGVVVVYLDDILIFMETLEVVTGITSLHSRSVLGRDSNKELSSIRAKGTSKGCEQSVVN